MEAGRNAPCPCGSGLKHKHCCAGKTPWYWRPARTATLVALVLVGSLVLAGGMTTRPSDGSVGPPGPAPEGKVWSEEHGHWHDAP